MKYYFISYTWKRQGHSANLGQAIINEHPLRWQLDCINIDNTTDYIVTNWKELTKEEYEEFKDHIG